MGRTKIGVGLLIASLSLAVSAWVDSGSLALGSVAVFPFLLVWLARGDTRSRPMLSGVLAALLSVVVSVVWAWSHRTSPSAVVVLVAGAVLLPLCILGTAYALDSRTGDDG